MKLNYNISRGILHGKIRLFLSFLNFVLLKLYILKALKILTDLITISIWKGEWQEQYFLNLFPFYTMKNRGQIVSQTYICKEKNNCVFPASQKDFYSFDNAERYAIFGNESKRYFAQSQKQTYKQCYGTANEKDYRVACFFFPIIFHH